MKGIAVSLILLTALTACSNAKQEKSTEVSGNLAGKASNTISASVNDNKPVFDKQTIATLDEPWSMTAIENKGQPLQFLVTQKKGQLLIVDESGKMKSVSGIPAVAYGGQGGLGDVILSPDFATTHDIYLSYAEMGDNGITGAKVIKATLQGLDTAQPTLTNIRPVWTQTPKVTGQGHYSHKLIISPDQKHLFISSGERQKGMPAQDMRVNLGKIIRLNLDGSVPTDNPFVNQGGVTAQIWSLGHRNIYGLAFDKNGVFWEHEMGPKGGDELNIIEKGKNYGWSVVSNGDNYDGSPIPDHNTHPEFVAPKISWTPVIAPSAMTIYSKGQTHNDFSLWQDKALISGLASQALVVVDLDVDNPKELYRYDMGARIRDVKVFDGQVYVLEDGQNAKFIKLLPKQK